MQLRGKCEWWCIYGVYIYWMGWKKSIELSKYEELMNTAIIYDGHEVKEYNIDYYSVGRKEVLNRAEVKERVM